MIETNVQVKTVRERLCEATKTDANDTIYNITGAQAIVINGRGALFI